MAGAMVPEIVGTVPGWITAGATATGLGIYLRYVIQARRLAGDRMDALERENRLLRADFDAYRKECISESDKQRQLIDGLRRQVMHLEQRGLEAMPVIPPATKAKFTGDDE